MSKIDRMTDDRLQRILTAARMRKDKLRLLEQAGELMAFANATLKHRLDCFSGRKDGQSEANLLASDMVESV